MASLWAEPLKSKSRQFGDLAPRLLSGVVLIALGLVSVWMRLEIFSVLWLGAAVAVLWEWQTLIGRDTRLPSFVIGGLALGFAMLLLLAQRPALACGLVGLATGLVAVFAGYGQGPWRGLGVLYAGALVLSVIALRSASPYGALAILWLYAIVWGTDIFAYFGGRLIGGAKIWPKISPGKTWSGTLTGVVSGAALGTILLVLTLGRSFEAGSIVLMFLLSFATAWLSQAGDLFESLVKRKFGAKNSGVLIPGHGGFMDRLDGFLVAVSFAALVGALANPQSIAAGLFTWF